MGPQMPGTTLKKSKWGKCPTRRRGPLLPRRGRLRCRRGQATADMGPQPRTSRNTPPHEQAADGGQACKSKSMEEGQGFQETVLERFQSQNRHRETLRLNLAARADVSVLVEEVGHRCGSAEVTSASAPCGEQEPAPWEVSVRGSRPAETPRTRPTQRRGHRPSPRPHRLRLLATPHSGAGAGRG